MISWSSLPKYRFHPAHAVLLLSLTLGQFILIGPSLLGLKVLAPLDMLAAPGWYLPRTEQVKSINIRSDEDSDIITQVVPWRDFCVSEVRQGRMPLWNPYAYCGSPFLGTNQSQVFSPYRVLHYVFPSPTAFAWEQFLKSIIAGLGVYFFARRAFRVRRYAAVLGANLYATSGMLVLWSGFTNSSVYSWLPWLFLFVHLVATKPRQLYFAGLAVVTAAALFSGHAATCGQVLLASGLYALWLLWRRSQKAQSAQAILSPALMLTIGWSAGFLLSMPQTLPTLDYLPESYRLQMRDEGEADTPTQANSSMLFVQPYSFGNRQYGGFQLGEVGPHGSARLGYVGLIATLLLAPLAWMSRGRRSLAWFWLAMAVFGIVYIQGVPVITELMAESPLRLLRNERLIFLTGFSIVCLATLGFDAMLRRPVNSRKWWLLPIVLIVLLAVINLATSIGATFSPIAIPDSITNAQSAAIKHANLFGLGVCIVALGCWTFLLFQKKHLPVWFICIVAAFVVAEPLVVHFDRQAQMSPDLYFPEVPVLTQLRNKHPWGRINPINCLPPNLSMKLGLPDIRGYDAADPVRTIETLAAGAHPNTPPSPDYARTKRIIVTRRGIAQMIGLRYYIYRGRPSADEKPYLVGNDYWVSRVDAMPRAWVPRTAVHVPTGQASLDAIADPQFDPAAVGFLHHSMDEPIENSSGSAQVVEDLPGRVTFDVEMQTPGLLVFSESWDKGWQVEFAGATQPSLRVNHMLNGVLLPAGRQRVTFVYRPVSFAIGTLLATGTTILLLGVMYWRLRFPTKRSTATIVRNETNETGKKTWLPRWVRSPFLPLLLFAWLVHPVWSSPTWDLEIDQSWQSVIHQSWTNGWQFGKDIVFTYGPYGFVAAHRYHPETFFTSVALNLLMTSITLACLWRFAIAWAGDRKKWQVITALLLPIVFACGHADAWPFIGLIAALLWRWSPRADAETHLDNVLIHLVMLQLVLFALAKHSFAAGGVLVGIALLIEHITRRKRFPWFVLTAFAAIPILWIVAGQEISGFAGYVRNSLPIIQGFALAMGSPGSVGPPIAYGIAACLVSAVVGSLCYRTAGKLAAVPTSVAFLLLWLVGKASFVRPDNAHMTIACCVLAAIGGSLLATIYSPLLATMQRRAVLIGCSLSIAVGAVLFKPFPVVDVITQVPRNAVACVNSLFTDSKNDELRESKQRLAKKVPLPEWKKSVDLLTSYQALLFVHDLKYQPRPVIQSYSAYTPELLKLNRNHFESDLAPEHLVFNPHTIDNRMLGMDDSLLWPILLTEYRLIGKSKPFLLMTRDDASRQWVQTEVGKAVANIGEPVDVPIANEGEAIWIEIELNQSLWGKFLGTAFRQPVLFIELELTDGQRKMHRFVPGIGRAGFLLSPYLTGLPDFVPLSQTTSGPLWQNQSVRSVSIHVADELTGEAAYQSQVKYRFYRCSWDRQSSSSHNPATHQSSASGERSE